MALQYPVPSPDERRAGFRVISDEEAPAYDGESQAEPFGMMPWSVFDRIAGDDDAQLVLLAVIRHANKAGICWPSVATIAKRAGRSERSVRYAINRLVELGIVAKESRTFGGMKSANSYRICREKPGTTDMHTVQVDMHGVQDDMHTVPVGPAHGAGQLTRTSELEPNELESGEKPPRRKPETDAPEDFQLRDVDYQWAESKGFSRAQCDREAETMINYHAAKGNRFREWHRAWRTWMDRAKPDARIKTVMFNGQAMPPEIATLRHDNAQRLKWENDHRRPPA